MSYSYKSNTPKSEGCDHQKVQIPCSDNDSIQSRSSLYAEYAKLHRASETPGGPLALKDVLILVYFFYLASGYENMNDNLF